MDHVADEISRIDLPIETAQPSIPEAIKCEVRTDGSFASVADVSELRFCGPQIVVVETAVLQLFPHFIADFRSGWRLRLEGYPADHVLFEIQYRFA